MTVSLAKIKNNVRLSLKRRFTRDEVDILLNVFIKEIQDTLLRGEGVQIHGLLTIVPTLTCKRNVYCIQQKKLIETKPRWKIRTVLSPKFKTLLAASQKKSPFRKKPLSDSPVSKT